MKKTLLIILRSVLAIIAIAAILVPVAFPPIATVLLPSAYSDHYIVAREDKLSSLENTEGPKIVVIGGSSVAFGLYSPILEEYTGMPVVNFGLYGALGTKLMLDLALPHIGEGDVVILAPELDSQTLSTYFDPLITLRATDGYLLDVIGDIPSEHYTSLFASSWEFAGEKIGYLTGEGPKDEGIYRKDNFNDNGDLILGLRTENVMMGYREKNNPVTLDTEIVGEDFIDYVNTFAASCGAVGADVVFTYCPINELSLAEGTDDTKIAELERTLDEALDFPVISYLSDYIIPAGYFYDTNYHLNDSGAILRTIRLANDLLMYLGDPSPVRLLEPEEPELPAADVYLEYYDPNSEHFEFALLADGSYMITGVKDEYKHLTTLTVPLTYNDYKVTELGPSFLQGSAASTLIITADTSLNTIMNGAFKGASNLSSLYIYFENEAELAPPADFVGTASDFKVYIPEGSNYMAGYYWGARGLKFVYIK